MFFEQAREQEEAKVNANKQDVVVGAPCLSSSPGHTDAPVAIHREAMPPRSGGTDAHMRAQALTRWGGALLELAHFRQGQEAYDMIQQVSWCMHVLWGSAVPISVNNKACSALPSGGGQVQNGARH
jgi:hypothetical protein